ncbi:unnamed protein product [Caenorhabditis brenneri]
MGFPILRLPVVALKVVLDQFNNVELVKVSLTSKRANWFLKACGKKNVSFFKFSDTEIQDLCDFDKLELLLLESRRKGKLPKWGFKLCCYVSNDLSISIKCRKFTVPIYFKTFKDCDMWGFTGVRKNLKIGKWLARVEILHNKIHIIRKNKTDGFIQFLNYFNNNFNLSIDELKFSGSTNGIRQIVNHIKSNQMVVNNVQVYPSPSENDFGSIVENVSATESFFSHLNLSQNFKYCKAIHAKEIKIRLGHWFTIQSLIASTESEVIDVRGSDYTKEELRLFLSEWKAGKLPKLKKVTLNTKVPARDVIVGFERWEGRCRECGWQTHVVKIKGHRNSYGCVSINLLDVPHIHMEFHDDQN